jgi:hypothetical protein
LVAYVGELDFSTDLVGDSQETLVTTNVLDSYAFFIDDKSAPPVSDGSDTNTPHSGVEYWKVSFSLKLERVHFVKCIAAAFGLRTPSGSGRYRGAPAPYERIAYQYTGKTQL